MSKPVIITCAVTGAGDTTDRSHLVPITPQQVADAAIEAVRRRLARFFSASPERVIFTLNATDALNIALKGHLRHGDHVKIQIERDAVLIHRRIHDKGPRALQTALLGIKKGQDHIMLGRVGHEFRRDGQHTGHTGGIVVGTVIDVALANPCLRGRAR